MEDSREDYSNYEFVDSEGEVSFLEIPDFTVGDAGSSGIQKKKKKRIEYFSADEKKTLANAVKDRAVLWDLTHKDHYNNNATSQAWRQIGGELNRTASDCKKAWIALRESHRYHIKIHRKKSGSDGGVNLADQSCNDLQWEFAEYLSFLPDKSKTRTTYTSPPETEQEEYRNTEEPTASNYNYQTRPANRNSSREDDTVVNLAENISQLIDHQRSLVAPPERTFVHQVQLANFDRMLQQLPASVAEDACFEITTLLYNKIKALRSESNI